ncbi:MAG: Fic family protein [Salinivirgaceae bacterium]|nr:Fic family protein [Salinivirgaceae bacterium]
MYIDFDEYIRQGEPEKRDRADAWRVAIGLQAVDGLTTSAYLQETARRNIEGDITIDEAKELVNQYYITKTTHDKGDADVEEADRVSANIVKVLSQPTFAFNTNGFISVHRRVFDGVLKQAGELRQYDITKKEWVLEGDTIRYLNWEDLRRALDYDMEQERNRSYSGKSADEMISQISSFVSGLWQIHPFPEGNTRTTAVFTIQYLRSLGFNVNNDLFAKHSWYFRNALVRANYKNVVKGIEYTPVYLERFFRNLLLGEQWDLRNRYLHINPTQEWRVQPNLNAKQTPDKSPDKSPDKFGTKNQYIINLVAVIGQTETSIKEMLAHLGLKNRESFMDVYLNPAIKEKFVRMLYPDKPRHPRQKYLLTAKGVLLYNQIMKKD